MTFHRACCCGCPATIVATFAGVDSSICVPCGLRTKMTSLAVDGAYSAPKITDNDTFCSWVESGPTGAFDTYPSDGCVGVATGTARDYSVRVSYNKTTEKIVTVLVNRTGTSQTGSRRLVFDSGTIAADFGDTISNTITCGSTGTPTDDRNAADAGTVIITKP